jgi:hypothetical protein
MPSSPVARILESPPLEVLCLAEAHRFTPGVSGLTQMNSAPATKAPCFWFKSAVQNCVRPLRFGRSVLSERQIPQVIVFSRKSTEKGEREGRACVRPRQVAIRLHRIRVCSVTGRKGRI